MPPLARDPEPTPPAPGLASPVVSVVVVNWNGASYVSRCLNSVLDQTYPALEVIVVDNASTDSSRYLLRSYLPRIRLIELHRNLGFAGGANAGIRASSGKYVALLNPDAVAEPDWLAHLVRVAESDPEIGMCASKVYLSRFPGLLDSAGMLISLDGLARGRGHFEADDPRFDREDEVLAPSACAALYRVSMLHKVGLFDEDFFLYCEDIDLALRAQAAGWRCRYVPQAIVVHDYSRSVGSYSPLKVFQVERNRIWLVAKCFPASLALASPIFTIARYGLYLYAAMTRRGAASKFAQAHSFPRALVLVARAWFAAFAGLPRMLRKRRALLATSTRRLSRDFRLRAYRLPLFELTLKD